jgi:hypothetical protein
MPQARRPKRRPVPKDVNVTRLDEAREPKWDSTLGIKVNVPAGGRPRHRLVTIGDSLTHGFQSGAIFNTNYSFPAIIARELGWYDQFRHPQYPAFGGIPLNIEVLIHELEDRFGDKISWWEGAAALFRIRQHLAQSEHWWDEGPGSELPQDTGINHNLGIYGWDIRDALSRTADTAIADWRGSEGWQLIPLIRNADEIAAIRVLHSARLGGKGLTPLGAAKALGEDGGIETLIVELGANNALGSVISLTVRWSGDGYDDIKKKAKYNVWRPTHFQAELDQLADAVREIGARHVIWTTVPHVTIAPLARGVKGKVEKGSRYFKYYTRPWIRDQDFNPDEDHPYLTADDARAIDSAIDQYNYAIENTVKAGRKEKRDWRLLDLAGLLDRLASRRYIDDPDMKKPKWWSEYPLPPELAALTPKPDSRFFSSGPEGRIAGGLFSLDGVHATTIAYGLMAQEYVNVMSEAGVKFYDQTGAARKAPVTVDFKKLVQRDTLISDPPRSLGSNVALIGSIDEQVDIFRRLWAGLG